MRFHIVGLGSIGTLVAFHLRRVLPPQHPIVLVSRRRRQTRLLQSQYNAVSVEDQGVVMSRGGFRYETAAGARGYWTRPHTGRVGAGRAADPQAEQLRASRQLKPARLRAPLQCVVLATKASAALDAVRALRHRIDSRTTLVLLQNGMGVYERLCKEVFPQRAQRPQFVLTSNTHGAWTKDTAHIVHAGKGALEFAAVPDPRGRRNFEKSFAEPGARRGSLADVAFASKHQSTRQFLTLRNTLSALLSLELNTRWLPIADLEIAMRKKLVVNSVINPLTAIMGCKNRDVFNRPQAVRILQQVCAEAEAVFTAQLRAEVKQWEEHQRLEQGGDDVQGEASSSGAIVRSQEIAEEQHPPPSSAQAENTNSEVDPRTFSLPLRLSDEPRIPTALRRRALVAECVRVAETTGDNFSSMLSDVRQGKPTEIEYMNGYLVALGAQLGVPTPTTRMLLSLVKNGRPLPLGHLPTTRVTQPQVPLEAANVPSSTQPLLH